MHLLHLIRKRTKKARRAIGNTLKYRILFLTGFLLTLMCLHILAMVLFEEITWGDAAWLTITTATTVGYGDISAATNAGRWSTFLLMYAGGIFVLAQLAGLIFEASQYRITQRLQGKQPIRARDHIIIFGWHENFITSVVQEIRESITPLSEEEIIVVSPNLSTLPDGLREADVHHVNGTFYEDSTLDKISLSRASRIVIIPDGDGSNADFVNLDLVDRLRKRVPTLPMIMACQDEEMIGRARRAGVLDALSYSPNYPDVLTRAILSLGAERVVEELINPGGAEMMVIHVPIAGTVAEIVAATNKYAILLGYRHDEGNYVIHPPHNQFLENNKLIFLIDVSSYGSSVLAERALLEALGPLLTEQEIDLFDEPVSLGVIGSRRRVTPHYLNRLERKLGGIEVSNLGDSCWEASLTPEKVNAQEAIVLLADDPQDPGSDAKTFVSIKRLREELLFAGRLIVEGVLTDNRTRFELAGATDVIRPVTQNLDILARCVLTGAEELLDSLYSSYGNQELIAMPLAVNTDWWQFSRRIYEMALPLAWEDERGRVVVPAADYLLGTGTAYLLVERTTNLDYRELKAWFTTACQKSI